MMQRERVCLTVRLILLSREMEYILVVVCVKRGRLTFIQKWLKIKSSN